MGVPFEALIPYAIMVTVTQPQGSGCLELNGPLANRHRCSASREGDFRRSDTCRTEEKEGGIRLINGIDKVRSDLPPWIADNIDNYTVMDRDRRLTGFLRGQTDNAAAPAGFELNNPWRV
ncbi:hypothetical protein LSUE1_G000213 [Lachnellula suecica]|uniref:NADH dehydrogenase [ubiquinone] 1 alpha subcomplex subunit 1 n=1 Tax=Lachnellula suecica TaxID=602035 RepID=A0A8T9CK59_9HELO|nr:hypothetical protein LSUE1_G000213 [Lachnellula suecica]